jgi:hypothetical protein
MKSGVLTIRMSDAANVATELTFALVKEQRIEPTPELGLPTITDAIVDVITACNRVENARTDRDEQAAYRALMLAARRLRVAHSVKKTFQQSKG